MIDKFGLRFGKIKISWILIFGLIITFSGLAWACNLPAAKIAEDNTPNGSESEIAAEIAAENSSGSSSKTNRSSSKNTRNDTFGSASDQNGTDLGVTYLVALGDSITRANGLSVSMPSDNPSYSFATGTNISSLYLHLKHAGAVTNSANIAVSGAKSLDVLAFQVPQVNNYNPKYISLLVGGNDILSFWAPSTFQGYLVQIAAGIQKEDRTVLIGTIPNYVEMKRANLPACEPHLNEVEEAALTWALSQYNSIVSSTASQYGFKLVDLYPYLGQEDISDADCIHPNISGQQKIANQFKSAL